MGQGSRRRVSGQCVDRAGGSFCPNGVSFYRSNGRDPRRRKGRRGSGLNFHYTTALFRASGLVVTSGSRSERGLPRPHTNINFSVSARPCPAVLLAGSSSLPHLLLRSSLTREKIQHLSEDVYPNGCRYFPVSGGGIGDRGKRLVVCGAARRLQAAAAVLGQCSDEKYPEIRIFAPHAGGSRGIRQRSTGPRRRGIELE